LDYFTNHANEPRVRADGGGSHHVDSKLIANLLRFGVEVE
jgi:hypothetical protein